MRGIRTVLLTIGMAGMVGAMGMVSPAARAAEFLVPDADAGIHTIADALGRMHPGDVVRISEGIYIESLTITTPSLTLIGLGGVEIWGPPPPGPGVRMPPVLFADGAADLHIENLKIQGGYGSSSVAVAAVDSSLVLVDVWIEGGSGATGPWTMGVSAGGDGGNGLQLVRSCCIVMTGVVIGGNGGNGGSSVPIYGYPGIGGDGGHAVILDETSRIQINEVSATGGDGGNAINGSIPLIPLPGGTGGDGLQANHASQVLLALAFLDGGFPGSSYFTTSPPPGEPLRLLGDSTLRPIASLDTQTAFLLNPNHAPVTPLESLDLNNDGHLDAADLLARIAWCKP
jgi:hypothetical protein